MIGNGCETNVFNLGECFAEALLRAPQKGALAYIGCTNDSYWDEDYYWSVGLGSIVSDPSYEETSEGYYDKVFHTHGEPRQLWTPSLGEMVFGGNMSVQQSNSSKKKFYWEIYQLAGDPTLVPWFSQPGSRDVNHPAVLPAGSNRMDVTCAPYDYVALSKNGMLLDALHASKEGTATLHLPDSLSDGTLELVVTGDMYRPYSAEVDVGIPDNPYLDLLGYGLANESAEVDGLISLSEQFSLDLQWINRGAIEMDIDTLVLFMDQSEITLVDTMVIVDHVGAGDTVSIQGVFDIQVGSSAGDQDRVLIGLYWRGEKESRKVYIRERISAPVLVSGGITWNDRPFGNGNGIAEQGEWLDCSWVLYNDGHFRTGNMNGMENPGEISSFREIVFDSVPYLEPGDSVSASFRVLVADSVLGNRQAGPFTIGDQFASLTDSFLLFQGRHYEDFSNEGLDNYPFINTSPSPWRIDSETFTSSMYSIRSGPIPNYGLSEFSVSLEISAPDTISFSFKVSSEEGYDYLKFYVDSSLLMGWSGETGWNQYSQPLAQGFHKITWTYQKDQSINRGKDAAWIDDVVFPSTAFRKGDLSLVKIMQPVSGPWLSQQEEILLLVRNTGEDTIQDFSVTLRLDDHPEETLSLAEPLAPASELEVPFPTLYDLSDFGPHHLIARAHSDLDNYLGNNKLELDVQRYLYPDLALSLIQLKEEEGKHTDAVIAVENKGNSPLDSLRFELWIDGIMKESGSQYLGLDPGHLTYDTLRLVDSMDTQLTTGIYTYLIKSTSTDSLTTNNEVSGVLYWHALGTFQSGLNRVIRLYPNPTKEGIHLELSNPANRTIKVELYNMHGRVEASYFIEKGSIDIHIQIPDAGPGNYILMIEELEVSLPVVVTD
ncbi:MAG: hypothetical protein DRI70_04730 [Bacteroidetes bacterium]|nr:MAG: hypothetical protein DRI70_04730 [Bacteroidota bacterium]